MMPAAILRMNQPVVASASTPSAVRSSGIAYVNNANSFSFALPSGSLAGDTCVIFAGHGYPITPPSGWGVIDNSSGAGFNGLAVYKTLSAGDITAGSVSIVFGGAYYGVVAGLTFVGAVNAVRTTGVYRAAGVTSQSLTTAGSASVGDIAVYFGSGRGNTTVTSSVGTQLQTTSNSEGSGVLAWRTIAAAGADSSTFSFASAPSTAYDVIAVFR